MRKTLSVFACALLSSGVLVNSLYAQGLPDEINHAPYYSSYLEIKGERDRTESSLGDQRERLESILKAINEKESYIATLEDQVLEFAKRIGYLERELPRKERDLSDAQYSLRGSESNIASLQGDLRREQSVLERERRQLRPIQRELRQLADEISRQEDRIKRLKREAKGHENDIAATKNQIQKLRQSNQALEQKIKGLEAKEGQLKNKISGLNSQIKALDGEISKLDGDITKVSNRVTSLKGRLDKEKTELARLRSSGASAQDISAQQRKVSTVASTLKKSESELSGLQTKKRSANQKKQGLKGQIAQAEREIQSLPGQITAAQNSKKQNRDKIQANQRKIQQSEGELAKLNQQIGDMETNVANILRRHRRLQQSENQIQRNINAIVANIHTLENSLSSEESRAAGLRNTISLLRDEIQNIREEIPNLERNIAYNRSEISNSQAQIASLSSDEGQTRDMIAGLEADLSILNSETRDAFGEYEQRKELYENYLAKARNLGAEQTDQAPALGSEKGSALASLISAQLGESFGAEEGRVQAKLIGFVRGENDGYPLGYDQGVNSQDSIESGRAKGEEKGKEAVYNFVRTNLKPGYFETHMQELLKMPVGSTRKKSNSFLGMSVAETEAFLTEVPDLQSGELSQSRSLKTPMDARIEKALNDVYKLQRRFAEYKDSSVAYNEPTSIPYTVVDCQAVYKGVLDYIQACEASFKAVFKSKYLTASYDSFDRDYPAQFVAKYSEVQTDRRERAFDTNYAEAHQVAMDQGEVDGKKDAYDEAYKMAYDSSYAANLEPAKTVADQEAQREGHQWIEANPILTVQSSSISKKNLRGGDTAQLVVDLKNISNVDSLASGTLRIKNSKNVKFAKNAYKLANVAAKSLKSVSIPFEVDANARSREQIKIEAELELPGDKYQAIREESLVQTKTLIVNPKYGVDLQYDQSPKIKGVFSYYVHTFSATIKPVVENLDDNYKVVLSVAPEQKNLMSFKVDDLETGVLTLNQGEKLDFSYVFKKAADGKTVKLKLEVFFKGESLDAQIIELYPH